MIFGIGDRFFDAGDHFCGFRGDFRGVGDMLDRCRDDADAGGDDIYHGRDDSFRAGQSAYFKGAGRIEIDYGFVMSGKGSRHAGRGC